MELHQECAPGTGTLQSNQQEHTIHPKLHTTTPLQRRIIDEILGAGVHIYIYICFFLHGEKGVVLDDSSRTIPFLRRQPP